MHEVMHALGFYHEQTRPDRDKYITVKWNNIQDNKHGQYYKEVGVDSMGSPYDFHSIMHYYSDHFSKGGPTMYYKDTEEPTAGRDQQPQITYSEHDLDQIREMHW